MTDICLWQDSVSKCDGLSSQTSDTIRDESLHLGSPNTPSTISPSDSASQVVPDLNAFSWYAKQHMAGDYDPSQCWACGVMIVEHCHVIGIDDTQSNKRVAANLFPPNFNRGDTSSGVLLCPHCRIVYDRTIDPGFVFLPTDLRYFIDYELEDARARAVGGSKRERRAPMGSEYQQYQEEQGLIPRNRVGGLYRRVFLDFMGRLDLTKVSTAKTWHGEPMCDPTCHCSDRHCPSQLAPLSDPPAAFAASQALFHRRSTGFPRLPP